GPKHLANCRRVLTAVVRRALRSRLLREDLTLSIQGALPHIAGDAPQADWLTPGELRAVLARARTLEPTHYPMLLVMATCGRRFGEAWALQVGDVDLGRLARETEGYAGADIEAICRKATMLAIREYLSVSASAGQAEGDSTFSGFAIRMAHLHRARELIGKCSVSELR
ncbi:MAG: hypothetical protein HYW08_13455, partial [candidate division NC10 bacterium]|nr:hypothetical protein [candidate division NC10 bacterium]